MNLDHWKKVSKFFVLTRKNLEYDCGGVWSLCDQWSRNSTGTGEVSEHMIELVNIEDKFNLIEALTKIIFKKSFRQHCATMQVIHKEHR